MKTLIQSMLILSLLISCGCGTGKPDPRDHPNFVDTTDPTKLRLPGPQLKNESSSSNQSTTSKKHD